MEKTRISFIVGSRKGQCEGTRITVRPDGMYRVDTLVRKEEGDIDVPDSANGFSRIMEHLCSEFGESRGSTIFFWIVRHLALRARCLARGMRKLAKKLNTCQ